MKGRRYKYIYIFIYIIHQIYFKNAILKRDNKSVIVREKEVHGKYLYSHERGLVDRIISHRGKEGSVVSQRVSHWDLSLKKERKERKTIDFHFFPPLLFHFRSSSFSRPFSQGFIKNFSRFEDQTSEECVESIFRFLFSLSRIAWITLLIHNNDFLHTYKKKSGKNLLESSFESMHICWSTERKILVARFEDHNIRRVAIPIKFSSLPKRHRSKSMARATIGIVGVKALCSCEFRNRRDYWARSGEPEGGRCRVKGLYVSLRKKNVDPLGPGQARPATVIHD